ncbi:MAG: ATP-binding protein [Methanomicrobiales archaeon]|nr:ATP-binding protein [Methanomicrobiales archaeon]
MQDTRIPPSQPNYPENELNYQALIEHSSDAIIVHDPQGKILYANPAALTLFGDTSLEEARKNSIFNHLPKEFTKGARESIQKVLEGATLPPVISPVYLLNGDRIEVEVRANRVDFDGQPAIQIHMRDSFSRAKLIESLKRQAEDLKRINEELEDISHIAAHDLQEPVRMIVTFAQRLEQEKGASFDAESHRYLQTITKSGLRMHQLLNDLSRYSRLNMHELRKEDIDTNILVEQVVGMIHSPISGMEARITRNSLPVVRADPTLLRIVFQNLIENAIKFHRPGKEAQIEVSAKSLNAEWNFSISDDGIGISPNYFGKIFKPFERLHSPDSYPGTGMGLSISKRIIERHGGRIWVESEEEKGSIFHFTLPVE